MKKHWTSFLPEVGGMILDRGEDAQRLREEAKRLTDEADAIDKQLQAMALDLWSEDEVAVAMGQAAFQK